MSGTEIKCSVIGLGKLGAPLAAVLAQYYRTIGVDVNPKIVEAINSKSDIPIAEPGLKDLILKVDKLSATTDISSAIEKTNVTFIIVPTPSNAEGFFSNEYVLSAIKAIGPALKAKGEYHLINITSTVMPGSMGGEIRQALEEASGKKIGAELGLTYNPEFIALGNVIRGLECPDMVLIGEAQPNCKEGNLLEEIYARVCWQVKKIARTSYINAEFVKLAINTFLTTTISFANTIAEICQALPNADAATVTRLMGFDSRIAAKFLRPGLAFGGPCLPRDTVAFSSLGKRLGVPTHVVDGTHQMNILHMQWIVKQIMELAPNKKTKIGILGLAYKADTDVIEESSGIAIAKQLSVHGYDLFAYDPNIKQKPAVLSDIQLNMSASLNDCVAQADLLIVTITASEFKQLPALVNSLPEFPAVVIDCWRMFEPSNLHPAKVLYLGERDKTTERAKRMRGYAP